MDPIAFSIAQGAAGAGKALYVDDVFSTYLYDGTGATQTITNGIDLNGEGGLTWIKRRDSVTDHWLFDTERGATKFLVSNGTAVEDTASTTLTGFNSDGFTLGSSGLTNSSPANYASWTFRKAPGFIDCVTWDGNSTAGRTISHNLGSVPGTIIVKSTTHDTQWPVYHRSLGEGHYLLLDDDTSRSTFDSGSSNSRYWNNTAPTSTEFTLSDDGWVNGTGRSYVAYIFAHDDQSFGKNRDESIIKCGTFSGTGFVDLGWEPQWIMIKPYTQTYNWEVYDNMRGMGAPGGLSAAKALYPNLDNLEANASGVSFEATGFTQTTWGSSYPCTYVAIRRPHKPPETGTDVFNSVARSGVNATITASSGNSRVTDMIWTKNRDTGNAPVISSRLQGSNALDTSGQSNEGTFWNDKLFWDEQNGVRYAQYDQVNQDGSDYIDYFFTRTPGVFDVVAFDDDNSTNTTILHNLGVTPELLILKGRDSNGNWFVWATGFSTSEYLRLDNSDDLTNPGGNVWGNATPTSSQFTFNSLDRLAASTKAIAYLFASKPGISKVGFYSGTGNNINVDCGFTAGARLVLIKRTDFAGDWYVWDSTRGIVSGNDPFLYVNTAAAEATNLDYIDPLNAGFTVTSSALDALNVSGGTYIFLAIA